MIDKTFASKSLLPSGFSDVLPTDAAALRREMDVLLKTFEEGGYAFVEPPLLEFEDSYLSGAGAALSKQCFRIMDPHSKKMMVVRPDITPQIARIASTRLRDEERPLRLCYCGDCITITPVSAEETRRQIVQTGIELIGPHTPQADVEVLKLGAHALEKIGVGKISFDLTMPPFIPTWFKECDVPEVQRKELMTALANKDISTIEAWEHRGRDVLLSLLQASGQIEQGFEIIDRLSLPTESESIYKRFKETVLLLRRECPHMHLTMDLAEFRGWRYHTGVCVSLFSDIYSQELGRGGRYVCHNDEPAFGLTLRPDILLSMIERKK